MAAIEEFFLRRLKAPSAAFSFIDPWDGQVYDDCSVAADELHLDDIDGDARQHQADRGAQLLNPCWYIHNSKAGR